MYTSMFDFWWNFTEVPKKVRSTTFLTEIPIGILEILELSEFAENFFSSAYFSDTNKESTETWFFKLDFIIFQKSRTDQQWVSQLRKYHNKVDSLDARILFEFM